MDSDWHSIPVEQVIAELARLNRGAVPCSFEECCDIAAALNWRILFLPPEEEQVAHISERKHIIYIPHALQDQELFRVTLHEISELITAKVGGEPEYRFIGGNEEHHNVAVLTTERIRDRFQRETRRLRRRRLALVERKEATEEVLYSLAAQAEAFALAVKERRFDALREMGTPDLMQASLCSSLVSDLDQEIKAIDSRLERWG